MKLVTLVNSMLSIAESKFYVLYHNINKYVREFV